MRKLNASQLTHLLSIPDPTKETIYGVVGRMEILIGVFEAEEEYRFLLPFLKTYYFVTKASGEKYLRERHFFWSLKDYETLDVYFASLYFKPLLLYLIEGKTVEPWTTYFRYSRQEKSLPFLRMLLGINAHINGDLSRALYELKYRHERDFFLVNDILQEVIPKVTSYLVFTEHDLMSAGGLVLKNFFLSEFHIVVEQWRSEAWAKAKYMIKTQGDLTRIEHRAEKIGRNLIKDFETGGAVPFLVHTLGDSHATENGSV